MTQIKATVYHNPKCTKSCFALEYLSKKDINIEVKEYMIWGITRAAIFDILELVNCEITDLLRTHNPTLIDKYCGGMLSSKEGIINSIIDHPILLQRPIILFKEKGAGAVARTKEELEKLLSSVI